MKRFKTEPSDMYAFLLNTVKYLEYNFPLQRKIVLKRKQNAFENIFHSFQ
jgi:hypothetical protein